MEIKQFILGNLRSNCYIVSNQNKCFIVDPGYESQEIIDYIQLHHFKVEGIYLTHGHYDHIGGSNLLRETFQTKVYAPYQDNMFFELGPYNFLRKKVFVDCWVNNEEIITFLEASFLVISTPGHTPGGTVLLGDGFAFSGDTLFFQSIGRTDLPLSDGPSIYQSIKKLYTLMSDETILYPGHGRQTSISHEKQYNPFVKG